MSNGATGDPLANDDRAILTIVYPVADFYLRTDLGYGGIDGNRAEFGTRTAVGLVGDDTWHLPMIVPTGGEAYRICSGRKMAVDVLRRITHLHPRYFQFAIYRIATTA